MADSNLRVYLAYVGVSMRGQMQYRASFVMLTIGHFMMTGIEFFGIWVLFDRFGSLRDWSLAEVALFYGIVNISFAIADATSRGFDMFHTMVKGGDFDRLLLRPRSTVLQLAGYEFTLRRIGRLTQGLLVLVWASMTLGVDWHVSHLGLLAFTVVGGTCLFYGLTVLQATLAFWTTETIEIVNAVTYGGVATAQYPLVIYTEWFRRLFTYVIPLACVSYYPVIAILGRTDTLGSSTMFQWLSPGIGIAFLLASLCIWRFGVRHYASTGS